MLLVGGLTYQNCGQMNEPTSNSEKNPAPTQPAMVKRSDALILKDGSRHTVQDSKKANDHIVLTLADGSQVKLKAIGK